MRDGDRVTAVDVIPQSPACLGGDIDTFTFSSLDIGSAT